MRPSRPSRRLAWLSFALAVLLVAMAGGLYAYGATRPDLPEGSSVAGVDVGGLSLDVAERKVEGGLTKHLERPFLIRRGQHEFRLYPRDVALETTALLKLVRAVDADEGAFARGLRHLQGAEPVVVELEWNFDERALARFVDRVAAEVNVEPKEASVRPTATSLEVVRSKPGLALRSGALERELREALVSPAAERVLDLPLRQVKPKVTTAELAEKYPVYLVASRSRRELRLFEGLKLTKTYRVAVGALGYETPAGLYAIQNKAVDPHWLVPNSDWAGDLAGQLIPPGPENPLKARWLGIYDGAGIHGTDDLASLGYAASHGCLRMAVPDVIELYDRVPVGTPIFIA